MTKYETKYKYLTSSYRNSKKGDLAHQVYELKLFVTKLFQDRFSNRK